MYKNLHGMTPTAKKTPTNKHSHLLAQLSRIQFDLHSLALTPEQTAQLRHLQTLQQPLSSIDATLKEMGEALAKQAPKKSKSHCEFNCDLAAQRNLEHIMQHTQCLNKKVQGLLESQKEMERSEHSAKSKQMEQYAHELEQKCDAFTQDLLGRINKLKSTHLEDTHKRLVHELIQREGSEQLRRGLAKYQDHIGLLWGVRRNMRDQAIKKMIRSKLEAKCNKDQPHPKSESAHSIEKEMQLAFLESEIRVADQEIESKQSRIKQAIQELDSNPMAIGSSNCEEVFSRWFFEQEKMRQQIRGCRQKLEEELGEIEGSMGCCKLKQGLLKPGVGRARERLQGAWRKWEGLERELMLYFKQA